VEEEEVKDEEEYEDEGKTKTVVTARDKISTNDNLANILLLVFTYFVNSQLCLVMLMLISKCVLWCTY
jgi:hypothetical protein